MIEIPHKCPRGRKDCVALANIVSDDGSSFYCCGENNGDGVAVPQDKYRVCFKGEFHDQMANCDKRDLIHQAAVILQGVAVIQGDVGEDDWSAWNKTKEPPNDL